MRTRESCFCGIDGAIDILLACNLDLCSKALGDGINELDGLTAGGFDKLDEDGQ